MQLEDRPASHRAAKVLGFLTEPDLERLRQLDLETRPVRELPAWAQEIIRRGETDKAAYRATQ